MSKNTDLIYQLEGKPSLSVAIPLGLQHVLAMFIGNLAPVLVLAGIVNAAGENVVSPDNKIIMIQCAMLVSGLTTFIQLYPIKIGKFQFGAGLPIVMGTSFAFMSPILAIGAKFGLGAVLGSAMLGGIVEIIMGIFIKPLKKFFPPLVVGSVLITIGVKLLSVGTTYFAGGSYALKMLEEKNKLLAAGTPLAEIPEPILSAASQFGSWQNLTIGFSVFLVVILLQRFGKGMLKVSAILIGIIVGYIVAISLGQVNFAPIAQASFFRIPMPFHIKPIFMFEAIFQFALIYVVSGLETIGNTNGITIAAFDREATTEEISGAIIADAGGSMLASMFNTLPNTAFGQNAGIIAMTKVVNKFCIATGAGILVLAGLVPKIGAVFSIMPNSVLGGAVITVFAMILINGIKLVSKAGFSDRNCLILAITFGVGYGIGNAPLLVEQLPSFLSFIFKESTASVCLVSILANVLFPLTQAEKDIIAAKTDLSS